MAIREVWVIIGWANNKRGSWTNKIVQDLSWGVHGWLVEGQQQKFKVTHANIIDH